MDGWLGFLKERTTGYSSTSISGAIHARFFGWWDVYHPPSQPNISKKIDDTMHMKPWIFHLFWEETSGKVNHGKSTTPSFKATKDTSLVPQTQLKRAHSHTVFLVCGFNPSEKY